MFIPICAFAQAGQIAPDNMVILTTDYPCKSTWTPTDDDVQKALLKIYEFIDNPSGANDLENKEIIKIKNKFSSYKVQFVGVEINGEKRIWCNFFCSDSFDYWKKNVVIVDDGGFCFWQIEYDYKTGKCINFISNGYA